MLITKNIAWTTGSGNITLTYQGQGNGTITVASDDNNGAARSQVITVETLDGIKSVNLTVHQAACPVPIGTVLNYAYTGSYQEVELPAGQYKLQCWGAQGGSNGTNSSYGITAKEGGKGGYSEGAITLTQKTTLRVYVGGQGSASVGGFNGGGSTPGSSSYSTGTSGQDGYHFGISKMGGGGGATDIRLSDGALLSRMIVAGGGSGGAMCYKKTTSGVTGSATSPSSTGTLTHEAAPDAVWWDLSALNGKICEINISAASAANVYNGSTNLTWHLVPGTYVKADFRNCTNVKLYFRNSSSSTISYKIYNSMPSSVSVEQVSSYTSASIGSFYYNGSEIGYRNFSTSAHSILPTNSCPTGCGWPLTSSTTFIMGGYKYTWDGSKLVQQTTTSTDTDYQVGGVGGGTQGGAYSSTYAGKQASAGSGGYFGQGANQTTTNYRYCSGAGGGGWYGGGGGQKSDSSMTYCKYSGGGSGFVNTAASAGNRPSGYTGLQLDSGTTYAGDTSFPAPGGGNEIGHSGNGYAKITRIS